MQTIHVIPDIDFAVKKTKKIVKAISKGLVTIVEGEVDGKPGYQLVGDQLHLDCVHIIMHVMAGRPLKDPNDLQLAFLGLGLDITIEIDETTEPAAMQLIGPDADLIYKHMGQM